MPAQTTFTNLPAATALNGAEVFAIVQNGTSVQTSLAQIVAYVQSLLPSPPFALTNFPSRVVLDNAHAAFQSTDTGLLINKTVAGATTCSLIAPTLGRMIFVTDMKGDAATNNITLDAGSGKTINGSQTFVMNANGVTTMLIGMSSTQWGEVSIV